MSQEQLSAQARASERWGTMGNNGDNAVDQWLSRVRLEGASYKLAGGFALLAAGAELGANALNSRHGLKGMLERGTLHAVSLVSIPCAAFWLYTGAHVAGQTHAKSAHNIRVPHENS